MLLSLKNVSKFYYSKGVVTSGFSRISLNFDLGEFVAITGESGSGKSTLLNVISGLDTYEEGEMYINGEETSAYTAADFEEYRKKYIANVFQNFNLVSSYSVYQNVALILQINGVKGKKVREKVKDALIKVGLWDRRHQKASRLSGGQKQRVAIARALVKETPIIVADEPTGNLDVQSATEIMKLFSEISTDRLVIIVTHNYEQVEPYVTRKIRISDGRVTEDLKLRPIRKARPLEEDNKRHALSLFNKIRLSWRNTFNIIPKFLLLLVVFLFMTIATLSMYASARRLENESIATFNNSFFRGDPETRMVIRKNDRSEITPEDFEVLRNLPNVESVMENDIITDTSIELNHFDETNSVYYSFYGNIAELNNFHDELVAGTMPENPGEIIVATSPDDYQFKDPEELLGMQFEMYLESSYSYLELPDKVTIVGVSHGYASTDDWRSSYLFYLPDETMKKVINYVYTSMSTMETLLQNNYFNSYQWDTGEIITNTRVPLGYLFIPESLGYLFTDRNPQGQPVRITNSNTYYTLDLDLTCYPTLYNEENLYYFLRIDPKDKNSKGINMNAFYINPIDYEKLFKQSSYQAGVYIKEPDLASETKKALQDLDYKVLYLNDTVRSINDLDIFAGMFRSIWQAIVLVALFFISYFIIRLVMRSRNTYFATLRMLGATRANTDQLLAMELFNVLNIAFIIVLVLSYLLQRGIIPIDTLEDLKVSLGYLHLKDYIQLYAILAVMCLLISIRYARQLFNASAMSVYKERD